VRRYLLIGMAMAGLGTLGAWLWARTIWEAPLPVGEAGYRFVVAEGSSLRRLSRDLDRDGVLPSPQLFDLIARLQGADSRIRHGEYRLEPGATATDLLQLLQEGDTVRYLVTLPEGIRLHEALEILRAAKGLQATVKDSADPRLLSLVGDAPSAEGFFLAETYQYEFGATDLDVLTQAHELARSVLETAWAGRAAGLPYARPYDALIMASIIEKETAVPAERPLISGVFIRRLHNNMRLQTDPTVIYGLGKAFDGNLRRAHLRDESNPYNTYRHAGLPPSPIALPGRAAIEAAFHPAGGEALYFVARGDGSHHFSTSLAEHQAAVREYQLDRRADYRSTPARRP